MDKDTLNDIHEILSQLKEMDDHLQERRANIVEIVDRIMSRLSDSDYIEWVHRSEGMAENE